MKKLSFLILISILAVALSAGAPPNKLVPLTILNKTGDVVNLRLEGTHFEAFYYLTIPTGEEKTFTVTRDIYNRTTWACGIETSGTLNMYSQVHLTFLECNKLHKVHLFDQSPYFLWDEPTQEKVLSQFFLWQFNPSWLTGLGYCGNLLYYVKINWPQSFIIEPINNHFFSLSWYRTCLFRYKY